MTTNDNFRGLLDRTRRYLLASQCPVLIAEIDAALAAPDSGEVMVGNNPAVAAIQYALNTVEEPMEFLRCWNQGDFDGVREWPNVPDEVFEGADPLWNKEPTKAEPPTRHWDDCPACTGVGYCDECTPKPPVCDCRQGRDACTCKGVKS